MIVKAGEENGVLPVAEIVEIAAEGEKIPDLVGNDVAVAALVVAYEFVAREVAVALAVVHETVEVLAAEVAVALAVVHEEAEVFEQASVVAGALAVVHEEAEVFEPVIPDLVGNDAGAGVSVLAELEAQPFVVEHSAYYENLPDFDLDYCFETLQVL
ncbi:MAG: hypothetical protein WC285_03845 [Candidatus Gracilibacteria bacterium]